MCEKRCVGTGMGCCAAGSCRTTLARLHCWQSATHFCTSLFIPGHTTLVPSSLPVTLTPGWAMLWKAAKTARRWPAGTSGHGWGPLVSHSSSTPSKLTLWRVRLLSLAALVSWQPSCAAAIAP